jgi:hypothetical protein
MCDHPECWPKGTPKIVRDAGPCRFSRPLRIDVTIDDISAGTRRSIFGCPIALAIKKSLPRATEVQVLVPCVEFWLDGTLRRLRLPRKAQQFAFNFDLGLPVEPLSFRFRTEV